MNVAVSADSPLGQYLAELDDDSSATTLAALLAPPRSEGSTSQAKHQAHPQPQSGSNNQGHNGIITTRWWSPLFASAQSFALELLLVKVTASNLFPDLRECALENALVGEATPAIVRWWTPQVIASKSTVVVVAGSFVIASNAICVNDVADMFAASSLVWMVRIVLVVFPVLLVAVEVVYQSLLLRYSYAASRFVEEMHIYATARSEFQTAFRLGLDIVKRSELAARGYRLGRILPPVGRLEEASSVRDPNFELQYRRLRTCLRDINDSIERTGRAVASRSVFSLDKPTIATAPSTAKDKTTDNGSEERATPSLLITALAKRHELSSLLMETALRDILVEDLTTLMIGRTKKRDKCFLSTLTAQAQTYRLLTRMVKAWTADLSRWNVKHQQRLAVNNKADSKSKVVRNEMPSDVAALSRALMDMQASSETLSTLARTSQHDIDDDFSGDPAPVGGQESATRLHRRLKRSRDQMAMLMQQLASDWDRLERAIQVVDHDEDSIDTSGTASDEVELDGPVLDDQNQRRLAEMQRQQQQDAERDFLVVFTATSTGEKDFDLQSLLRQQQQLRRDGTNATPVPSFMGELHNVLERRQALPSAPTLEKRIGDDVFAPPLQVQTAPIPSTAPPQAADLQQLLRSRFTAQLTEESFGGDDTDEEEADIEKD